mgnify:CR=1 FL=1
MPQTAAKDEPALYNSRIIDAYIKLIRRKYPDVDLRQLLEFAGMRPQEVNDQGHWFTQSQVDRFYEKAVALTGNDNIAREAGRYAASPESIGVMRQYVLGLAAPAKVYEVIGKVTANLVRSSVYESRLIASNKVEIVVSPNPGTEEKRFQCENRKGFFEAIMMVFNSHQPRIEHPEPGPEESVQQALRTIREPEALFFDLDGVLDDVREDLQFKIEEQAATITADSLPRVEGDEDQLRQVFQNLLDNAMEYSGDEPPRIRVSAERDGDQWLLSISDDGIGIDADHQDRVFEVFQRLHTHDDHAGTGIGLSLCRRIVERHGGEIWVDSDPGAGSTFSFTLPAVEGAAG